MMMMMIIIIIIIIIITKARRRIPKSHKKHIKDKVKWQKYDKS
jgi:preprotein translocase subunit SecY